MSLGVDPTVFPVPQIELLETDGEPLESDWHRLEMNLLIEVVTVYKGERTDYFVGGNLFIYFDEEEARHRNFRGPDFFYVDGVELKRDRPYWAIWLEGGRYPDLIIELSSPTTIKQDLGAKKDLYERIFHTYEYVVYDPSTKTLHGWRMANHHYEPIATNERGWLWCKELGLWLGLWEGEFQGKPNTYLRFYYPEGGLVPTMAEAGRERAEAEARRADEAARRAEAERRRADAAEAELARLREALKQQSPNKGE